jgi:hypothetical protein
MTSEEQGQHFGTSGHACDQFQLASTLEAHLQARAEAAAARR